MYARVALLRAFNAPLSVEQVEVPALMEGQALVRVEAAGVCGSDVHMWQGRDPRTPLPIVLGHEAVGRVVEVCGHRRDIHGQPVLAGQRLLWERGVTCGRCYYCAVLCEPALCSQRWVYGIYRSFDQPPHLNGCYASHIILDKRTHLVPLADDIDPAHYVAASCSGATAAHGFDLSPAHIGDTVVIWGPGPLGAFSVVLARAAGAEQIIVIGGTPTRLALCEKVGATLTLNRREMTAQQRRQAILDLTHGRGADLTVEASGTVEAAREALDLVRYGGSVSWVGFGAPVGEMSLLPFEDVVRKNVRVQGVWVSDVRHTLRAVSLVQQHPDALAALVTHRYPLDEATRALNEVDARDAMKAVLIP
jgi:threonine dehydrogenase-like Zn-dependent dehydrogenase